MKFYWFHPGMKFTCKQNFFSFRDEFHPGMRFISVTCKHTLRAKLMESRSALPQILIKYPNNKKTQLQLFFTFFGNFFNPFYAIGLFLYPLKTSENLWFSDVFRGYRMRPVSWNALNMIWRPLSVYWKKLCFSKLVSKFRF